MIVDDARNVGDATAMAWGSRLRGVVGRLRVPDGALARRFVLVGLALALQNGMEMPHDGMRALLGDSVTSVLIFAALVLSLLALTLALRPADPPNWRWLDLRSVRVAILAATFVAVPIGLIQLSHAASTIVVRPPTYENDGTTLDHYAAMQLLSGHDPYVTTNLVRAIDDLHQDPIFTTPLHAGAFASYPWTVYPKDAALRAAFAQEPSSDPNLIQSFESHLSYPALAVLPLVPLVWAGLPSVVPFFLLCLLILGGLLVATAPPALRPWVILFLLADAPLLDATVTGDLDVLYILLLFVAWRWLRRPMVSGLALGLACAAKQLAWFFLPYYIILTWRTLGLRAALQRLALAGAVFVVTNAPFVLANPHAWLTGVLAPEVDPMFPLGSGLVRLALAGVLPLFPPIVYTVLEVLAFLGGIAWYARSGWRTLPEFAWLLAVAPLFFAWRSLATYFYFVGLPALVLLFDRVPALATATQPLVGALPAWGRAWLGEEG